jgi:hypothetical protein
MLSSVVLVFIRYNVSIPMAVTDGKRGNCCHAFSATLIRLWDEPNMPHSPLKARRHKPLSEGASAQRDSLTPKRLLPLPHLLTAPGPLRAGSDLRSAKAQAAAARAIELRPRRWNMAGATFNTAAKVAGGSAVLERGNKAYFEGGSGTVSLLQIRRQR